MIRRVPIASFISLLLLLANFGSGYSQSRSTRFQHLTIEDGLPQNMVDCMLQDSQGFMWFGTWNGLCRYDGYSFEIFKNENNFPNPFETNFIYALHEDAFGNIWIGTRKGLYVFIYDQARFVYAVDLLDGSHTTCLGSRISSITQGNKSELWIGTVDGLVVADVFDKDGHLSIKKEIPFENVEGTLSGTMIRSVFQTRDQIWVGTDNGIHIYDLAWRHTAHFTNESNDERSLTSNFITKIVGDTDGTVWVASESGLNAYQPQSKRIKQYLHDPIVANTLPHNSVMDLAFNKSGELVIATLGGLSILDKSGNFINFKNELKSEYSLNNNFINCLLVDKHNNLWIGTERGGVNIRRANQNAFRHFEFEVGNKNSLSHNTVNSIFEDNAYLWIGTAGGGLSRYDKKAHVFRHYKTDPAISSAISSDFVTAIFKDKKSRLWIGTWGTGLNMLRNASSIESGSFVHHSTSDTPEMVNDFISTIIEDKQGNLWIGTLGGLMRYDITSETFETIEDRDGDLAITEIGCLVFDHKNQLWIGSRYGLFKMTSDEEGYHFERFVHEASQPHSISGNYVISAYLDKNDQLWFGTYGQGVNRIYYENGKVLFDAIQTSEGISNNIVYSVLQDNRGDMWFSTDYGLSRLHTKTGRFRNFYISDGLLNNQYYWAAGYKNDDGKLYFGGMNGLDSFYPEWIKEVKVTPEVVITDVKLFNESVVPGKKYHGVEVLTRNISRAKEINLSYKEKNVVIEFSSFNYQEPDLTQFSYFLEGFDTKWNNIKASQRFANYTNLKPGDYIFHVKASGPNGVFSDHPTELSIIINPPFWDTVWFKVLLTLFIIGSVFGYIRMRTYSLNRQKRLLEEQVKERTERINQQKEALSYQAVQLQKNNYDLEHKQLLIEGQNHKLEHQNTEILRQRDKLIQLNKKLKLVSQLKLSFFTNISHEFRTPLTLIISPAEKVLKENHLDPEVKNTFRVIYRNAQRLLHLVNQIIDFRKIEKGRMELQVAKGSISQFCDNLHSAFQPLAEIKDIDFSLNMQDLPDQIWFDAHKMENIAYNLLSNAFKYTPNKGRVILDVRGLALSQSKLQLSEDVQQDAKTVISMKVSDSGIGISEENLPLVFKRFYRIESEEAFKIAGSGIGLALTEELIHAHHGDIFVTSSPGKGSEFEIQFPCLRDFYTSSEVYAYNVNDMNIREQVEVLKDELLDKDSELAKDDPVIFEKSRATILVVEDNTDLRKFIIHRLNKRYNILEAGDGRIGIELAEKHNPDVIISDVMMPEVDGLELCATIKNNLATSHIPVILLTAKTAIESRIQGLEVGADDYLPKPFNFELLEARIQNLITSRERLRKLFLESSAIETDKIAGNTKDQKFLEQAIRMVENHMEDPAFGVKEFVEAMGISRSLLHKKLTSLTNQSAAEFINHLKMKKAMQLLEHSENNISEVAYAVGFNDPKYFSRVFSKHYGHSPKEYAKKMQH